MYQQVYFEALDLLVQAIADWFDQPGYRMYCCLQDLLFKAIQKQDYTEQLKEVVEVFSSDINPNNLKIQLDILANSLPDATTDTAEVQTHMQQLSSAEKLVIHEVVKLAKLIPTMPATNAASERLFSAMRCIKSYLQSTMTQERLNHLMILHVHKEKMNTLVLTDLHVANEFVSKSERRQQVLPN